MHKNSLNCDARSLLDSRSTICYPPLNEPLSLTIPQNPDDGTSKQNISKIFLLPTETFMRVVDYLDKDTYQRVRLASKKWGKLLGYLEVDPSPYLKPFAPAKGLDKIRHLSINKGTELKEFLLRVGSEEILMLEHLDLHNFQDIADYEQETVTLCAKSVNLRSLDLRYTNITLAHLQRLVAKCTMLKQVDLSHNVFRADLKVDHPLKESSEQVRANNIEVNLRNTILNFRHLKGIFTIFSGLRKISIDNCDELHESSWQFSKNELRDLLFLEELYITPLQVNKDGKISFSKINFRQLSNFTRMLHFTPRLKKLTIQSAALAPSWVSRWNNLDFREIIIKHLPALEELDLTDCVGNIALDRYFAQGLAKLKILKLDRRYCVDFVRNIFYGYFIETVFGQNLELEFSEEKNIVLESGTFDFKIVNRLSKCFVNANYLACKSNVEFALYSASVSEDLNFQWPKVVILDVRDSSINITYLSKIVSCCPNLNSLLVDNCLNLDLSTLTQEVRNLLELISKSAITELSLTNTNISIEVLSFLLNLYPVKLKKLNLENCKDLDLSSIKPYVDTIRDDLEIKNLSFANTNISTEVLQDFLTRCPHLKRLDLANCAKIRFAAFRITPRIEKTLAGLKDINIHWMVGGSHAEAEAFLAYCPHALVTW